MRNLIIVGKTYTSLSIPIPTDVEMLDAADPLDYCYLNSLDRTKWATVTGRINAVLMDKQEADETISLLGPFWPQHALGVVSTRQKGEGCDA